MAMEETAAARKKRSRRKHDLSRTVEEEETAMTPATAVETKKAPPRTALRPTSSSARPAAANETALEKRSGMPLPSARRVAPATAGGRRSSSASPCSAGQK